MSNWSTKLPSGGTFTIGATGSAAGIGGLYGTNTITLGGSDSTYIGDNTLTGANAYINFSLIKANGGTIVQCRDENTMKYEYHVIPENVKNFDRELGKIISMQLLKG